MNFYFHPEAEQELLQVVSYYENCRPGLGIEFSHEVYLAIIRIYNSLNHMPSFQLIPVGVS